ncbi:MAG: CRISPR-associated protein Cas4 [Spirochaetes bacterium]|nr:CRISPR-associated protein Cas4 [Spirochaetota bacterium]
MIVDKINGSILNSFYICKRKTWFLAHEISPDHDNTLLEIGRLIEENYYGRSEKGINLLNIKIDVIVKNRQTTVVAEIKKSSKNIKPAIMQVSYYLLLLKEQGIIASGEILIPKERKKIPVSLTEELENELNEAIEDIERIIIQDRPPQMEKIKFCTNCAYREFCFS